MRFWRDVGEAMTEAFQAQKRRGDTNVCLSWILTRSRARRAVSA